MAKHLEFDLSTGNLLLGNFVWSSIVLPEGWTVKKADTPPDISYTTMVGNSGWVQEGEATYYLVNLVSGEALELGIRCRKRGSSDLEQHPNATLLDVSGHVGKVTRESIRAGLIRKKAMQRVKLAVACEVTRRVLELSITGDSQSAGLDQIAELLSLCKCH